MEGIDEETLSRLLTEAEATCAQSCGKPITKADLFELRLAGADGSAALRRRIARALSLPSRLSSNALLEIFNAMFSREEFFDFVRSLRLNDSNPIRF